MIISKQSLVLRMGLKKLHRPCAFLNAHVDGVSTQPQVSDNLPSNNDVLYEGSIHRVDKNNILFTRNNVILDMVEKMTNNPFVFNDEEMEDYNILKNNKELAFIYAVMIIGCIAYIVISDHFNKNDK
jgi:hypothetical protein